MNGLDIKKLLISNKVDLNKYQYFDNETLYPIENIPKILVSKEVIRKKLFEKYGVQIGQYIISSIYDETDLVEPEKILNLLKK